MNQYTSKNNVHQRCLPQQTVNASRKLLLYSSALALATDVKIVSDVVSHPKGTLTHERKRISAR
jgi:hypothetical protein